MGGYTSTQKKELTQAEITIVCMESGAFLEMTKANMIQNLKKKDQDLYDAWKNKTAGQEGIRMMIHSNALLLKKIEGISKLIRLLNGIKEQAGGISAAAKSKQGLDQYLNQISTIVYGAQCLNYEKLNKFPALIQDCFGPDLIVQASKLTHVDQTVVKCLSLEYLPVEEIISYFNAFLVRTGLSETAQISPEPVQGPKPGLPPANQPGLIVPQAKPTPNNIPTISPSEEMYKSEANAWMNISVERKETDLQAMSFEELIIYLKKSHIPENYPPQQTSKKQLQPMYC